MSSKDKILSLLEQNKTDYISGESMANSLGLSRIKKIKKKMKKKTQKSMIIIIIMHLLKCLKINLITNMNHQRDMM